MQNYRAAAHTRFDIKYHFVCTTKYRKAILRGQVALRLVIAEYIRLQGQEPPQDNAVFRVEDPT
jgi:REP element-mobilizing transposase RayT